MLTSSVLVLVPCGMAVLAGVVYLYGLVANLLSKTSVRNKVVVITDALSSLGKGVCVAVAVLWSAAWGL